MRGWGSVRESEAINVKQEAGRLGDNGNLTLFSHCSIMPHRVGLRRVQRLPVRRGDVRLSTHTRPLIPPHVAANGGK
ncbi:hypothetical protein Pmani_016368 [Petrolisthes manimaculis]|uniref:Uncharacterized protein n=1 Tax=Petrolisthes manimaculis TaxID=1843537 RepID=A0AAE1UB23_9EUCA|nr:hypothetical protein Pmani_016368 [Petrolisthes manimaculis]